MPMSNIPRVKLAKDVASRPGKTGELIRFMVGCPRAQLPPGVRPRERTAAEASTCEPGVKLQKTFDSKF